MSKIEFWYDFASTYSYLTAMRIVALAGAAGVDVVYRPFLLGPIFKAQGWNTSPFNLYPVKSRYMVRDISRIAAERGIAFHMPEPFPVNSLHAARLALVAEHDGWIAAFTHSAFAAQFAQGRDIADRHVLASIVSPLAPDAEGVLERSAAVSIKDRLRHQTERAAQLGIFGAPTFIAGNGELFWGDDRLEHALAWTRKGGRP